MAARVTPTKTVYTVSQFLSWQKNNQLDLSPVFQRRPVWKPTAKSLLIDSVARGYPLPIILLRRVQDLDTLETRMEVIDGQQRLRTLLGYINPETLSDYDSENDNFHIRKIHNKEIAGLDFSKLDEETKNQILEYEISTHVFPPTTGDAVVFKMFARLNSTGLSLNHQEIRNAEFHGAFKSLVYDLSFDHYDTWTRWGIFDNSAIARMKDADTISDLIMTMQLGIIGKSQPRIKKFYEDNDNEYSYEEVVRIRFNNTLSVLDKKVGDVIGTSSFQRSVLFYSLFAAIYDHLYGLSTPMVRKKARNIPAAFSRKFESLNDGVLNHKLPAKIQDAMDKGTSDKARRDTRHKYLMRSLGLESAS